MVFSTLADLRTFRAAAVLILAEMDGLPDAIDRDGWYLCHEKLLVS